MTIIRTRGILWIRSDQTAAEEEPFGALGFSVVSEQARVAGVAAVPSPITDEQSDLFFVHQFWQSGVSIGSEVAFTNLWTAYPFDSKAMRKVADGDAIVVVMENAHAVDAANYILKFRMLFKLH